MMIRYRWILPLFLLMITTQVHQAFACGNRNVTENEVQTENAANIDGTVDSCHCSPESCCDESGSEPCSGDNAHGHCHCPGCGTACHTAPFFTTSDMPLPFPAGCSAAVKRQAFYFAQHLPEAVYLPIWQPPKLAA